MITYVIVSILTKKYKPYICINRERLHSRIIIMHRMRNARSAL